MAVTWCTGRRPVRMSGVACPSIMAASALRELAGVYCDLQVHKHVRKEERLPRLKAWFVNTKKSYRIWPGMNLPPAPVQRWAFFALCRNCLIRQRPPILIARIKNAYFPWVQGLHILLDYLIDQEEDRAGLDLNFCSYYENSEHLSCRLSHFYSEAQASVASLPNAKFHHLITRGLLGIYLADHKVSGQKDVQTISKKLLALGGSEAFFFYLHCWIYRRLTG